MNQLIDNQIDEFIEKSKTLNGQIIQERESWNTEVTEQAIRHFAYGISDDNPLWLNSNYVSQTKYGFLLAPPTFLTSVLISCFTWLSHESTDVEFNWLP